MNNYTFTWGVDYFGNPSLQIIILGADSGLSTDPDTQEIQQAEILAAIQGII